MRVGSILAGILTGMIRSAGLRSGLVIALVFVGFAADGKCYRGEVARVVDGDTIDSKIDLGFSVYIKRRVRFFGVDAPETRTRDKREKKRGIEVRERVKAILPVGRRIRICEKGVGKFGRILAYIYVHGSKTSINELVALWSKDEK